MKKAALITILTILILTLTACDGASNTPQADPNLLTDSYENALPVSTQLLIGTFNLEDTDHAVTTEQAKELIPLWQVLQSLSSSDTAAQAEMDALVGQIQETMTPEQIQAIQAMNLTREDMFALLQEQGFGGQGGGNFTPGESGSGGDGTMPVPQTGADGLGFVPVPGSGGGQGGGPGFGGGQGQGLSPEQISTAQASRAENGGGFRLTNTPAPLIAALIQFLQEKAGS
jgi:hypothetical protein